ncbi:MAG: hypothetical protein ABJA32_04930 [Ginsengibacter sp.]
MKIKTWKSTFWLSRFSFYGEPKFTWPGLLITLIGIPVYYWVNSYNKRNGIPTSPEENVE